MTDQLGVLKDYIVYLCKAKDQHSVHSPFVYHLLTNCIFKQTKQSSTADYKKAIKHFLSLQNITFYEGTPNSKNLSEAYKNKLICCFFISDIHREKAQNKVWEKIISDKNIQISIDCWSFGLIFTKKDQEKEHFILIKRPWR